MAHHQGDRVGLDELGGDLEARFGQFSAQLGWIEPHLRAGPDRAVARRLRARPASDELVPGGRRGSLARGLGLGLGRRVRGGRLLVDVPQDQLVSDLLRRSRAADRRLATLSLDTEIRFRSAADRAAFSNELIQAVTSLVARYHDASTSGGRVHRLVIMAHPLPHESQREESSCQ